MAMWPIGLWMRIKKSSRFAFWNKAYLFHIAAFVSSLGYDAWLTRFLRPVALNLPKEFPRR